METRHRNTTWILREIPDLDGAQLAVLMDIREELKLLNGLFRCPNFRQIPSKIDAIRKNTARPKRKKKKL